MSRCELCGKGFKSPRALPGHVLLVHKIPWEEYKRRAVKPKAEKPKTEAEEAEANPSLEELAEAVAERLSSSDFIEKVAEKVGERLKAGGRALEAEEVEVVGEKVNYKIALNPEVFWRYNVFQAEVKRRGNEWRGSFADFIDMATKDILAVYGIHPTVLTMRGSKITVELPPGVEKVE